MYNVFKGGYNIIVYSHCNYKLLLYYLILYYIKTVYSRHIIVQQILQAVNKSVKTYWPILVFCIYMIHTYNNNMYQYYQISVVLSNNVMIGAQKKAIIKAIIYYINYWDNFNNNNNNN